MKKLILLSLCLLPSLIYAQTTEQYCEVYFAPNVFTNCRAQFHGINFGSLYQPLNKNDLKLQDTLTKIKCFPSIVDALNYINSYGWQLVSHDANVDRVQHLIFKRPAPPIVYIPPAKQPTEEEIEQSKRGKDIGY